MILRIAVIATAIVVAAIAVTAIAVTAIVVTVIVTAKLYVQIIHKLIEFTLCYIQLHVTKNIFQWNYNKMSKHACMHTLYWNSYF